LSAKQVLILCNGLHVLENTTLVVKFQTEQFVAFDATEY